MKEPKALRYQESTGSKIFNIGNIVFMLLLIVIMIYPLIQIIAMSFSDPQSIAKAQVTIWPIGFNVENYKFVLGDIFVFFGYRNSLMYAALSTVIMLLCTSMMAYPLTVHGFPIRKFITIFLTITMFFNGGLIPTYLLMKSLGLRNTIWIMILPGCVGAYTVFMFRTFFFGIPAEMRESAQLDGANDFVVLFRIILPLSKALLASFALFNVVGVWNSWFNGLIYLDDQKLYPLQLVLRNYLFKLDAAAMLKYAGAAGVDAIQRGVRLDPKGVQMAMIVVSILPVMMVYPFLQKYFVKGVMIGAIKG